MRPKNQTLLKGYLAKHENKRNLLFHILNNACMSKMEDFKGKICQEEFFSFNPSCAIDLLCSLGKPCFTTIWQIKVNKTIYYSVEML